MDLLAAVDAFVTDRKSFKCKPATLRTYRSLLVNFCNSIDSPSTTSHITRQSIRSFFAHLVDRDLSPVTLTRYDGALRTFCAFCLAEGWITADPMATRPRLRSARPVPDTWSLDDVTLLLSNLHSSPIDVRDKAIFLALLDTGLRAGELCQLTPARLEMNGDRGRVFIPAAEAKGVSDRHVPFWTATYTALDAWLAIRPARAKTVFTAFSGHRTMLQRPLSPSGLNQLMHRRADAAGLGHKRKLCHIWRHSFARYYILNGDLESLRLLMGHANIETTRIYLHFRPDELAKKHFELSPVRQLYEQT